MRVGGNSKWRQWCEDSPEYSKNMNITDKVRQGVEGSFLRMEREANLVPLQYMSHFAAQYKDKVSLPLSLPSFQHQRVFPAAPRRNRRPHLVSRGHSPSQRHLHQLLPPQAALRQLARLLPRPFSRATALLQLVQPPHVPSQRRRRRRRLEPLQPEGAERGLLCQHGVAERGTERRFAS